MCLLVFFLMIRRPPRSTRTDTLFPSTTLFRSADAVTGEPLWDYDPRVADVPDFRLRNNWGVRGIAYWNGKIYTGTADGRLIAIDARTGKPVWTAQTYDNKEIRYITGRSEEHTSELQSLMRTS